MTELNVYAIWASVLLSAASFLYTIFNGHSKRVSEKFRNFDIKIGTVVAQLDLVESRVTVVENDVTHLPDKEVTHRLELALANMGAELGKLSEKIKPIASMADRMQEAILDKVMA